VAEEQRLAAEEEARKMAAVQAITEKLEKEKLVALMQAAEGDGKPGAGKNKAADLERFRKLAEEHHDQAALQRAVQEKVMKAKDKEAKERVEQARRVDYLVRALREAERPKVDALLAATLQTDELYVRSYNETQLERKRAVHDEAMRVKARIARMLPYSDAFEEAVLVKRRAEYAKQQVRPRAAHPYARSRARALVRTRARGRRESNARRKLVAAGPAGTFGCPRTPAAPLRRHPDERIMTPPSRCGAAAGRARDDRPGGSLPTRSLANISCARNF
jgi:translation initiation factor 3 subunit A